MNIIHRSRREFISLAAIGAVAGTGLLSACGSHEDEGQKVSPPEDLMQEHGLLNRILLIYDHCGNLLQQNQAFPIEALQQSATIIRTFVEDYHEKQEERWF